VTARELEIAAAEIRARRRTALERFVASVLAAALVPAALQLSGSLSFATGLGAAVLAALGAFALTGRRLLLERLALEPDALGIPEVKAFGERLTTPSARARLAGAIRSMVRDACQPASRLRCLFIVDRVATYARDLEAIARDLCSPAVRVDPVTAARCQWLLTNAAENPLYDRRLPAEDLGSILQRIRAGMQPAREAAALAS
jgi:hypothetical protein